jgi:uncharacterized protein (DUF1015 family)
MTMATIKPFMGVRYNAEKIGDLSKVVSQPHDRVRHGLQQRYHDMSPYNVVRLIKGKAHSGDDDGGSVSARARDTYLSWVRDGVLVRDQMPAVYVLRQKYGLPGGGTGTRLCLIGALELSDFDEGTVLPHEDTLPDTLRSRVDLLRATSVNLGTVLMLYAGTTIDELLAPAIAQPPTFELREHHETEVLQQFWVLTDPFLIASLAEEMAATRNLIIADGHHRYEASLRYREEMRRRHPEAPSSAGFNHRLVALASMDDPDLTILATHRLIHANGGMDEAEVLHRAEEYFEVEPLGGQAELAGWLHGARGDSRPCFGVYDGLSAGLTLRRPDALERLLPGRSRDWRLLDVTVAHELFIERVLGIGKHVVMGEKQVEYLRDPGMGYAAVDRREADLMLLMRPTRVEQVQACSLSGERMPQKSTDFYPKVISGLVMLPVGADERL